MELNDLVKDISNFETWSHSDKIKLFAWHFHHNKKRERFHQVDIRWCYDVLNLQKPNNVILCSDAVKKTKRNSQR